MIGGCVWLWREGERDGDVKLVKITTHKCIHHAVTNKHLLLLITYTCTFLTRSCLINLRGFCKKSTINILFQVLCLPSISTLVLLSLSTTTHAVAMAVYVHPVHLCRCCSWWPLLRWWSSVPHPPPLSPPRLWGSSRGDAPDHLPNSSYRSPSFPWQPASVSRVACPCRISGCRHSWASCRTESHMNPEQNLREIHNYKTSLTYINKINYWDFSFSNAGQKELLHLYNGMCT